MLRSVINYFGNIGSIQVLENGRVYQYEVSGFKNIAIIINHFNQYPLQTTKFINFTLLCMARKLYSLNKPLSLKDFSYIIAIKAAFPKGLNISLSKAFPNVSPIVKPSFFPRCSGEARCIPLRELKSFRSLLDCRICKC